MLTHRLSIALVLIGLLHAVSAIGCGKHGTSNVVVRGDVSVGGEPVESGQIRFVPIDGNAGPIGIGDILAGRYEISARGGVPPGKHRVEVEPLKKTGRKVPGKPPFNDGSIDELQPTGALLYRGENSPLIVDTATSVDGEIDLEIPAK
ncbi:hypothetical protein PLANPX_3234 [Lacipirellula parvula]|uniref:Carboxypeptidase regulatory-like domain-containing protein n=2 Tax=Lacipirellula parvula TaxID=2650471 RepID=A0A5K7XCD3_9BACT|nr:hypothetical protein PLANPX_3234 [Lacipirellula parvula]